MIINAFIDYWKNLAASHVDINYFAQGDAREILGPERDKISYPCLWLETPDINPSGSADSLLLTFTGSFVVLKNSAKDDKARQLQNLADTQSIVMDIIWKIMVDASNGAFPGLVYPESFSLESIPFFGNDNDQGFRVTYTIDMRTNSCYDAEKWE